MNKYFDKFSVIDYNNASMINITERAAILNKVVGDRYAFYPYRVKNGMRAEQIAEKYYGDPDLVWLVYLSNDIIDPYHQWPMDEETFKSHIDAKYGSIAAARAKVSTYRVNWYEDTRQLSKIQYDSLPSYEKKYWQPNFDNNNLPLSFIRKEIDFVAIAQDAEGNITLSIPEEEQTYWSAVSAYDLEEEENSNRANIRLLDSRLAQTAVANLRQLLGS